MAKITWTFKNEEGTNLNRYIATNVSTGEKITFDLLRNGNISVVGTPLNATNLNALITSINACYDLIASSEKDTTYTLSKNGNAIRLTSSSGVTNDVTLDKSDVGLSNVDNTSDISKPISTATQNALDNKVPITRKINGKALNEDINLSASDVGARPSGWTPSKSDVGLGNVDNTSDLNKPISTATQNALNGKANSSDLNAHISNTSNPHNVTKAQVGLGNVDNTSDLNKPISTLQQKGLDKSLYNLGAFDTISGSGITRKTGYINKNNITSYGINGDYPSSTAYITGDFLTRINNVNNIKSNKNIYLHDLTTDNVSFNKIDGAFNNQEALDQFISELEIQYETKTSYTDGKIGNQPLITLDSQGSQWLRDEWEKGINLYSGEKTCSGKDTKRVFAPKLQLYNNSTLLKEFYSTDVNTVNKLVLFTFTKPSNCNILKFGHNGSKTNVTITYDISNLPNETYTLSFLVTSYTGTQSFTDIMLNEGTHALPYQEYNGGIVRENQLNKLLNWVKNNVVIEKTKYVSGLANGYNGSSYYYTGSFTVDGTVKTASFTRTIADKTNISHSGNTITYTLYTTNGGTLVTGDIKYTYGM